MLLSGGTGGKRLFSGERITVMKKMGDKYVPGIRKEHQNSRTIPLFVLAHILLLITCSCTPTQSINRIRPCTVQIQAYVEAPAISPLEEVVIAGTGFVVNTEGYIVTNAHVVDDLQAQLSKVTSPDKRSQIAFVGEDYYDKQGILHRRRFTAVVFKVIDIDHLHDLALLKSSGPVTHLPYAGEKVINVTACNLSTRTPDEGSLVLISGYPLYIPSLVTQTGIIASNTFFEFKREGTMNKPVDYFLLDATLNPGNSGSPVYLPHTGEIVGVVDAYRGAPVIENGSQSRSLSQNSGIAMIIPTRYVIELLKKNNVTWK
jgi:S1-C subfamily serine protease